VKCEAIRMRLSAYMDGEVDDELHREIAGHLRQCSECRQELEELGGVWVHDVRAGKGTAGSGQTREEA
jgi:predicted anti-sigma-YlaC factor YlaD